MIEREGPEEVEGDVLVARGDDDLVTFGPQPRDRLVEEMHVSGMTDIHEHAHASAE